LLKAGSNGAARWRERGQKRKNEGNCSAVYTPGVNDGDTKCTREYTNPIFIFRQILIFVLYDDIIEVSIG
jgi:hypothetical protein